jgi:hypothetical protein
MKKPVSLILVFLFLFCLEGQSQKVIYSEPDRDDARAMNFEVLGRLNGKVLVYKNYRELHFVAVFDNDMKQIGKTRLEFLSGKILSTEFIQYSDYVYMFYQYQRKNMMYCMAVKLDADGKKMGDPIQVDTTEIDYSSNSGIYTIINSEDKQKIMVFKINSRSDKAHVLTTNLFDKDLKLLKRTRLVVAMPQRNDFLSEFSLDNDGDLACVRLSGTAANDNINKVSLLTKPAMSDNYFSADLKFASIFLDDVRIKIDNINKHYLVTSFVSKQRRGNIEGLYYSLWDKPTGKELMNATTIFSDEFRDEAKAEGSPKTAFNDFFLKQVILRKDGGFIVVAESAYTSSRGSNLNRWDYLYGSPYWSPSSYYTWNNPAGYYPWYRSSTYNNLNALTRYYADNIAVISFAPDGKLQWSNVLRKSQFDDNTDNFIGYGLINGGNQAHFLFNVQEKREMILTSQSIFPDGQIGRNPTFKNMDKGYEFMPRHAKQVASRMVIVPCQYRGFTCFAKIEF